MSRVPYPPLDALSPVKHDWILGRPRKYTLNVTKMMLHVPDGLWQPATQLAVATVTAVEIAPKLREMIIVRLAHLEQSDYELFHHRSIASGYGVTAEQLAALESDDIEGACFDEAERAMLRYASELAVRISPGDATLAAARAHYSDAILFEVIVIIGYYMMTARIIAVGGVERDEAAVTAW